MIEQILLLVAGLALVVCGADWLVDGAGSVARKAGISEFVIGLTIVGFGTSCPELVVSLTGALDGNADVSIGNVVGSNIFNTLLILGLTAIFSPVAVSKENKKRDIPMMIGVSAILILFILTGNTISRIEGAVMLILFAAYLFYCFKFGPKPVEEAGTEGIGTLKSILLILVGLAGLIFGGKMFVDSAVSIASTVGVSDKFIALTLLAGGTSLPELATSVVAGIKGKSQIAIGNIIGSNIFNILLILGCSSLVIPLSGTISTADILFFALSALSLTSPGIVGKDGKIGRWGGAAMLAIFALYFAYLFLNL